MEESQHAYPLHDSVISYICRISQPRWNGKDIVIALHISTKAFSYYIDEEAGRLTVQSSDGRQLYSSFRNEEETKEEVTTFSYLSPTTGLCYTYDMSDNILYADASTQTQIFLMNFLLSVLFNVALLMAVSYYSNRVYQKKLLSLWGEDRYIEGGENKSFDSSLKQLREEMLTLHDTVNSSKALRFQSAVRALILNRKSDDVEQLLMPSQKYNQCRLLVIQEMETKLDKYPLENLQKEFLGEEEKYCALLTTMEKGELVMVLNFQEEEGECILPQVLKTIQEYSGRCRIMVGRVVPLEKDEIRKVYQEACEAVKYYFIFSHQNILLQEEIQMDKRKDTGSHLKLFEAMEKDINSENLLEFKMHLEMLTESFKNGCYTIGYCHSTLRDLVTLLYRIIQRRNQDMWVLYGYDIREYYKQITSLNDFQSWMNDICEIFLKSVVQKRRQIDEDGDLKTRLSALIEENLESDISLDFLCEKLLMRPDAMSRAFRQVMGEGYTEYVKRRKLERAIQLMEEGSNVKDIAQRLGYSSSQYFIKVFKGVYGITPYQYKKKKEENGSPEG